jgi:HSP20 family molecular chaperone IbpA
MEHKVDYQKNPAQTQLETERTRNRKVYVPKADIIETGDAIVLFADMPGADEKSVDVTLEKNVLTITGKVKSSERAGRSMFYAEYDVGDFERAFTISDEVDRERIEATVKNGVLKLTLRKAPQAEVRRIAVRTA